MMGVIVIPEDGSDLIICICGTGGDLSFGLALRTGGLAIPGGTITFFVSAAENLAGIFCPPPPAPPISIGVIVTDEHTLLNGIFPSLIGVGVEGVAGVIWIAGGT